MGSSFKTVLCSGEPLADIKSLTSDHLLLQLLLISQEMGTFEFESVWTFLNQNLIWFVVVVLILLATLFVFFLTKNYIIRRRRKSQSKPDHVDLVSVLSVTSENGPKEEEEEEEPEEEEEESIDLTEQGNGERSECDADAAVVIPDVHIPDKKTPDVVVHIPDEQDISVRLTSNISSV